MKNFKLEKLVCTVNSLYQPLRFYNSHLIIFASYLVCCDVLYRLGNILKYLCSKVRLFKYLNIFFSHIVFMHFGYQKDVYVIILSNDLFYLFIEKVLQIKEISFEHVVKLTCVGKYLVGMVLF